MIKWIINHAPAGVLAVLFYIAIGLGAAATRVQEAYYIVFRIPYYKGTGKFHYYVVRKSNVQ